MALPVVHGWFSAEHGAKLQRSRAWAPHFMKHRIPNRILIQRILKFHKASEAWQMCPNAHYLLELLLRCCFVKTTRSMLTEHDHLHECLKSRPRVLKRIVNCMAGSLDIHQKTALQYKGKVAVWQEVLIQTSFWWSGAWTPLPPLPIFLNASLTGAVLQCMLPKPGVRSGRSMASRRVPAQTKRCGLAAGAVPRVRKQKSFRQVAPAFGFHLIRFHSPWQSLAFAMAACVTILHSMIQSRVRLAVEQETPAHGKLGLADLNSRSQPSPGFFLCGCICKGKE